MEEYSTEEEMKKIVKKQEETMKTVMKVIKEMKTAEYEKNPLKK